MSPQPTTDKNELDEQFDNLRLELRLSLIHI